MLFGLDITQKNNFRIILILCQREYEIISLLSFPLSFYYVWLVLSLVNKLKEISSIGWNMNLHTIDIRLDTNPNSA